MKQSFYKKKLNRSLLPLRGLAGFLLWVFPLWLSAQTSTQNYIVTTAPYQAVSDPTTLTDANSNSTIQYFDGLGRPSQTVQRAITTNNADLVTGIMYDSFGRDSLQWLPAVVGGNNGAYYPNFATQAVSSNSDAKPYSRSEYEPSPLNRATGQSGPGVDWYNNNKKKTIAYTTNGSEVKYFYVEGSQLKCNSTYTTATLYGQKTTDEDGKTVEEFTDKQGRKVLSRMTDVVAGNHDTYYVYDDLDNLRYVLPPMAADALNTNTNGFDEVAGSTLYNYGYVYHYDGRKRCTDKKLPGCEPIIMVYDLADRLILSQDGNQRAKPTKQWTVTKYDVFGRVLYTGLVNSNDSRATMESYYSGSVTNESYTGSGPVVGYTSGNLAPSTVLTVNYYDSYGYLTYSNNNPGGMLTNTTLSGYTNPDLSYTKTLLTGTRVYHLDNPSLFEVTALYYDKYGRIVQTRATNHLPGYDITYNKLDFRGKVTKSQKEHNISGQAVIPEVYRYAYDKAERLILTRYKLGANDTITLAANSYDELGRLRVKVLGAVDATTYSYNVRSWTTDISGSRFSENLYYNVNPLSSNVCFNGNIAGMQWSVPSESLGYNRAYTFAYDDLNRLTDANYCGFSGSVVAGTLDRYNEHFGFDKMGNITNFARNGLQANNSTKIYSKVDDLVLEHVGNQLTRITDSGTNGSFYGDEEFFRNTNVSVNSCAYDANGNRLYDSNSNIWGIRYNILNLPDAMQFYQGHQTNYIYSATGAKLKVIDKTAPPGAELPVTSLNTVLTSPSVSMITTTDYVGNMIYENGTLKRILTPVGYWQAGTYYYFLKDHLGSNRVVMTGSGGIAETSSYYPSGMRFGESSVILTNSIQPYRHTGHEMQEMHGLNWIDNLARFRTVSDGSGFTGVDPLCEKYYSISPYVYSANNPINIIDSDGKRLYFVGGANNDRDGWNYINRWGNAFTSSGIRGFTRMNVTRGKSEDIAFTTQYRNSGTETYFKGNVSPSIVAGLSPTSEVGIRPVQNGVINDAVNQIKNNLANNPLKAGEQLNLGGYSYGSVVQAQAALKLANSGTHIDNLILIGSPISTKSDLYKQLSENNNIGNIIRVNIPNDGFSNPEDMKQFLYGVYQSIVSGDNAPHFDLARPGATADNAIKAVTDWLKTQGVK